MPVTYLWSQKKSRWNPLGQLVGEDTTNGLLNSLEQSRGAIKDFEPSAATGRQALKQILQDNTGTSRFASLKQAFGFSPKTDFIGAFKDFNAMEPAERTAAFGAEAGQAHAFLKSQARWQALKAIGKWGGTLVAAHALGVDRGLLHLILE